MLWDGQDGQVGINWDDRFWIHSSPVPPSPPPPPPQLPEEDDWDLSDFDMEEDAEQARDEL